MKTIILGLVEKSPWGKGRIGQMIEQDWYAQCIEADKYKDVSNVQVWIVSCFCFNGCDYSTTYYRDACLRDFGLKIQERLVGFETVSQLLEFQRIAKEEKAFLKLIVTQTHIGRVKWICAWKQIEVEEFIVVSGIPRPSESITDPRMERLYPVLQKIGLINPFLFLVRCRRRLGIL